MRDLQGFLEGLPGRYQEPRLLGRGAASYVFRAKDTLLGREVALKLLLPPKEGGVDPETLAARLRREATVLAGLDHPAVVKIHDILVEPALALVMELVEGETLADQLARKGPRPAAEVAALGAELCDALAHAHARGVLHRDLKPEDVMCLPGGGLKLLDFGFARLKDPGVATVGGPLLARFEYAAPELRREEEPGEAADLYSVGVVLFELLTGARPYGLMQLVAPAPPPARRPRELVADVPEDLDALVCQLLEPDPTTRLADAAAVRERLLGLARPPAGDAASLLAWVEAVLRVVRNRIHPLKNRLALVRRYPDRPERVRELLARPGVREESLALARQALDELAAAAEAGPPDAAVPSPEARAALEALVPCFESADLPGLEDVLSEGFEACKALVEEGLALSRRHMARARDWAEAWAKRAAGEVRVELAVAGEGSLSLWVVDKERWEADLGEVAATLLANSAEAGASRVRLELARGEDELVLRFVDDGPGLPAGDPEQLFEQGCTHKAEGTGLGLWDARERVQALGGTLAAAVPGAGGGACFEVRFPVRG